MVLIYHPPPHTPQECVSESSPRRSIWLAVSEKGVSLLDRMSMKVLSSYSYDEISTFGGNGDTHFMLVTSPQNSPTTGQRSHGQNPSSQGNIVERLMFKMPKLKVCNNWYHSRSKVIIFTGEYTYPLFCIKEPVKLLY